MEYEAFPCPKTGFIIKRFKPGCANGYVRDGDGFMRELDTLHAEMPIHPGMTVEENRPPDTKPA